MLKAGEILDQGRVRIVREIGRGSFGLVYEAEQLDLQRKVALKILTRDALSREGSVERFIREARMTSTLRHPQAVSIYSCGKYKDENPYLVMEYLDGQDFKGYLQSRGKLSEREATQFLTQLLGPLEEAHARGIVHRDLKPENLFLCKTGSGHIVKILDFGIAKAFGGDWTNSMLTRITSEDVLCGTPSYMAPEQITDETPISPATDIYSVGCMLYEMLSGRPPFVAAHPLQVIRMHVDEAPPPLPVTLQGSPLASIVGRCLEKNPEDRFEDASAVLRALRGDDAMQVPWDAPRPRPELRVRSSRLAWDADARQRLILGVGRGGTAFDLPRGGQEGSGGGSWLSLQRSDLRNMLMMVITAASVGVAVYAMVSRPVLAPQHLHPAPQIMPVDAPAIEPSPGAVAPLLEDSSEEMRPSS